MPSSFFPFFLPACLRWFPFSLRATGPRRGYGEEPRLLRLGKTKEEGKKEGNRTETEEKGGRSDTGEWYGSGCIAKQGVGFFLRTLVSPPL